MLTQGHPNEEAQEWVKTYHIYVNKDNKGTEWEQMENPDGSKQVSFQLLELVTKF